MESPPQSAAPTAPPQRGSQVYDEMCMGHTDSEMIKRARDLRKNMTRQERRLWYDFLSKHPARFRRQQPIGPYIVDFFCPSARLVIELDGGGHYEWAQYDYDRKRDFYLQRQNMRVLRFTNLDVDRNFSGVCTAIERSIVSTD